MNPQDLSESFSAYASRLKKQMTLLEDVKLPTPLTWTIDWEILMQLQSEPGRRKNWKAVKIFEDLKQYTDNPGLYYFQVDEKSSQPIFDAFQKAQKVSSALRREKGLKHPEYFNLSKIPKKIQSSSCLYAGSVKSDIHSRLKNHLGIGTSGRTGSLQLKRVMNLADFIFPVTFFVHVLDKNYINVSEHMECVLQDELKPILGKRAFKEFRED